MSVSVPVDRLATPLAWAIGAVLTLAAASALALAPAGRDIDTTRAEIDAPVALAPTDTTTSTAVPQGTDPAGPATPPPEPEQAPPPAAPLGPASVPVPGVHRYEVTTTGTDGGVTVQEERREIEVLSGDRTAGTVQISARLAGESQISVLDWSPAGVLVRSTRIESTAGSSRDCSWDPPFPELGRLRSGETWGLDSSCTAPVAGVDTRFAIVGQGRVVGERTVSFAGGEVRVWQIHRDRTTTVRADLGDRSVVQTAREEGELLFDPGRGLVIRSDVTVTLGGTQTGVTRRVSVLQPG